MATTTTTTTTTTTLAPPRTKISLCRWGFIYRHLRYVTNASIIISLPALSPFTRRLLSLHAAIFLFISHHLSSLRLHHMYSSRPILSVVHFLALPPSLPRPSPLSVALSPQYRRFSPSTTPRLFFSHLFLLCHPFFFFIYHFFVYNILCSLCFKNLLIVSYIVMPIDGQAVL